MDHEISIPLSVSSTRRRISYSPTDTVHTRFSTNARRHHARPTPTDPRARAGVSPRAGVCTPAHRRVMTRRYLHTAGAGPPPRARPHSRARRPSVSLPLSRRGEDAFERRARRTRTACLGSSCAFPSARTRATTRRMTRATAGTMTCTVARVDTTTRRERRAAFADIIAKSVTVARTGWRSARRGDVGTPSSRSSTSFCVWGRSSTRVERRCCWRVGYER